jgi:heat-inducible transcriptional repressor
MEANRREEQRTGAEMGTREALVLTAVVENYIASGNPVASQSIARQQNRDGMSAATVRNLMADLDEAGYLEQPHTSAGRVPTARAFRYYVQQLLGGPGSLRQPFPALPQPARDQIEGAFAGVANATDFFARTSHVLALLSGGVGVALTAPVDDAELLEHIHFVRLGRARVLTVLVTTAGTVRDRLLALEHDWTSAELEIAANYLHRNFHGWPLEQIRQELVGRMERERGEYDRILKSLEDLWIRGAMDGAAEKTPGAGLQGGSPEYGDFRHKERSRDSHADSRAASHKGTRTQSAMHRPAGNAAESDAEAIRSRSVRARSIDEKSIFVEGVANLMVEEVDRERLRRILTALEEKRRIIDLLDAYIDSRSASVRVIVGLEDAMPEMRDLALIARPAHRGLEHLGTVAVIGPTRMQYASTIGAVNYVADLFGRWSAES